MNGKNEEDILIYLRVLVFECWTSMQCLQNSFSHIVYNILSEWNYFETENKCLKERRFMSVFFKNCEGSTFLIFYVVLFLSAKCNWDRILRFVHSFVDCLKSEAAS